MTTDEADEMKWINNNIRMPLHIILNNGNLICQFYNSWDKKYHLAEFTPRVIPPTRYLYGEIGNFSPSRDNSNRDKCLKCWNLVKKIK